jgi:hypothetical protein
MEREMVAARGSGGGGGRGGRRSQVAGAGRAGTGLRAAWARSWHGSGRGLVGFPHTNNFWKQ